MIQRKHIFTALLALGVILPSYASADQPDEIPRDSLKVYNLEEDVVVIASPKENRKLRELPTSVTQVNKKLMQAHQIRSIKDLTGTVPNIFIPNYGSKLSSAIYIRGIGSRINTPSVGLYVDNVPYIDKSAFDFDFSDVERIDILRGPQSTLYGRNTMGGLIKVYTKSPFDYQGTDFKIGTSTYGDYDASVAHYHRVNNNFAFSTGGFFKHKGGFFKNTYLDKQMDKGDTGGGRFRGILIPSSNLKLDLNVNYEYSDEGGFPYGAYNKETNSYAEPNNNKEHSYRRSLFNTGLNLTYQAVNFDFSAITGYQRLKDRMFIDQDFSPADIFTIMQKQQLNTLSEEFIFKSKPNRKWEWTTGLFGFAQNLRTDGPVWFHQDGIRNLIERGIKTGLEQGIGMINNMIPPIQIGSMPFPLQPSVFADFNVLDKELLIDGVFKTPIYSGSFYHQSTINDLFIDGLSLTAGFRVNYEHNKMKYNSNSAIHYGLDFGAKASLVAPFPMPEQTYGPYNVQLESNPKLQGDLNKSSVDFLPRFALQYNLDKDNSVYATVSRGYRSGGYNVQMFSDLIQSEMQTVMRGDMMKGVMGKLMQEYNQLDPDKKHKVDMMVDKMKENIPPHILDMIQNGGPTPDPLDIEDATVFKPEYTWNYEVGTHLNIGQGKFIADYALFLLDTKNQQIAKFAQSGLGRVTVNAGKSRSYGAEAAMRYRVDEVISLHAAYGFTHAEFTEYKTNKKMNGKLQEVDYKGKRVPFVPRHTLNAGIDFNFAMPQRSWLDGVLLSVSYSGVGKVYWTEENDVSQKFYGTLNANLSLKKGKAYMDIWGRNLYNKDYATFYFESMGNGFMQKGAPIHFGLSLGCQF